MLLIIVMAINEEVRTVCWKGSDVCVCVCVCMDCICKSVYLYAFIAVYLHLAVHL